MSSFRQIVDQVAIQPTQRYAHPTITLENALRRAAAPAGAALPVPPGKRLFWRVNDLVLLDNFDGLFDRKNEINVIALTVDSNAAEPIRFTTPSVFPGIRKGDRLPIGDAGLGMYMSTPAQFPEYIAIHLLVMEDDQGIRDAGKVISQVLAMPEYKAIVGAAKDLASAANPLYGTLVDVGNTAIGLVAKLMEQNKDDLVAYFAATYTLAFDGLGVGKHSFFQAEHARVQYEILAKE